MILRTLLSLLLAFMPPHGRIQGPTLPGPGLGAGSAAPPFTIVETVGSNGTSACSTGLTLTFGTATTSGEAIIVGWETGLGGGAVTLSDGGSDTYTKDYEATAVLSHYATGVAHVFNVASGITTVKLTNSGENGCVFAAMHVQRSSGTWAVDKNSGAPSLVIGTPWASPTVTTTTANELLIGLAFAYGSGCTGTVCTLAPTGSWSITSPNGYTNSDTGNGNGIMLSSQRVSSIQTNIANTGTSVTGTGGGPYTYPGIVTYK